MPAPTHHLTSDPLTGDPLTADTLRRLGADPQFATRRPFAVEHHHQRSRCDRVRFADGGSVFVKRAVRDADGHWSAAIGAEGRRLAALATLGVAVPRPLLVVDDQHAQLVVTEDLDGREPLDRRRRQPGGEAVAWARAVGAFLADLHRITPDPALAGVGAVAPATDAVRAWTVLTPRTVTSFPAGYAELARRLRTSGLVDLLHEAVARWRTATLIHGDVKADNALCAELPDDAASLRLVDWELAGWGDPRWDVGALIGDHVYEWLSSMTFTAGGTLAEWTASAMQSLGAVRAELRAALGAYTAVHPVDDADRRQWMACAAMFLLQRASASSLHAPVLPAPTLAFLQVATQLLRHPDTALEVLT